MLFRSEGELRKGSVVTCEVLEVKDGGLEVKIAGTELTAFIKRNELARDRSDQRPERFSVGEKVDARVTQFDRRSRKITTFGALGLLSCRLAWPSESRASLRGPSKGTTTE